MKEEWREIFNFEGLYEVSNLGRVRGLKSGKILKFDTSIDGYYVVRLYKKSIRKSLSVSKLVATHFISPIIENGFVVDHKDNVKTNNKLDNLQIISHRDNCTKDRKNDTGFAGVWFDKRRKKYTALLQINKSRVFLGSFNCPTKAYIVRLLAVKLVDKYDNNKNNFRKLLNERIA